MALSGEDPDLRVEEVRAVFRGAFAAPRRLSVLCLFTLIFFGGVLGARYGTDLARVLGGLAIALFWGVLSELLRRNRADWAKPDRALLRALGPVDEDRAARASRAYTLWKRTELKPGGESPELALVHLQRTMGQIPMEAVRKAAQKVRVRLLLGAFVLVSVCGFLLLFRSLAIVEGVSVLSAQSGVGSLPIAYVEQMSMTVELPLYLDGSGVKRFMGLGLSSVPVGSEIEVRILPRVADRELLLTDGLSEIPFVSDGQGAYVARWKAEEESELRVGARFGAVIVYDAVKAHVAPTNDNPPVVLLEGEGTELQLADFESLPLRYRVLDDHGISQVDLVIRSGQRTERKELVHLNGEKRVYDGAHTLARDHELIHRAFLPVRVSIEARDENTSAGLLWGKSGGITLIPEPLGHGVAKRHIALRTFRSAMSSYLASDIRAARLPSLQAEEARKEATGLIQAASSSLREEITSLDSVPIRSLAFLEAQVEALSHSRAEGASPESVLLAVDALIQEISGREAVELAKALGSAVEEIAVQTRQIRLDAEVVDLKGLDDLVQATELGAARLQEVGSLGLDLGSVARGDLARVRRSLNEKSYDRAEAAALHLAERLSRATPSFSSSGGGVESGRPPSGSAEGSSSPGQGASDAPSQFDEMSGQIDKLAQETAEELSQLEKMLQEAQKAAEGDFESTSDLEEARRGFEEALKQLPKHPFGRVGSTAEAAAGRSQGEAMVDALDTGDLSEALERGLDAESALKRAQGLQDQGMSSLSPEAIEGAQEALAKLLKELRKAQQSLEEQSQVKMDKSLSERGAKQRQFAERAREISERGQQEHAPLGKSGVDALKRAAEFHRKAADEMDAGRAEQGAQYAEQAQGELENALPKPEPASDSGDGDGEESGDGAQSTKGSVPGEERDRAREFRRRVEQGLGREGGGLSPAIRRYAEELK
jgi:hypothetical protein